MEKPKILIYMFMDCSSLKEVIFSDFNKENGAIGITSGCPLDLKFKIGNKYIDRHEYYL